MQLSVHVDNDQTTQQECLQYERIFNEQNSIRVQESAVACEEKAKASNLSIELNVVKTELEQLKRNLRNENEHKKE